MLCHQVKILYHLQKVLWAPLISILIEASERPSCLRMQNKVFRTLKILILRVKYQVFGLMKEIWLIKKRHQQDATSMLSVNDIIHHDHMGSRE